MELTQIAMFLNNTFANYDYAILNAMHNLAVVAGNLATPFLKFISFLGEDGLFLIALSLVLMLFKKTRKVGICMFGAIGLGGVITSVFLKDVIARPRPFLEAGKPFEIWWRYVGAEPKQSFSFPSGHVTATMAAMTSIFLLCCKKYSWTGFIFVGLMGVSRNYLMVHYPSDVLGGIVVGFASAYVAYLITKAIYKFLEKNKQNKFCMFVNDFDIIKLFKK